MAYKQQNFQIQAKYNSFEKQELINLYKENIKIYINKTIQKLRQQFNIDTPKLTNEQIEQYANEELDKHLKTENELYNDETNKFNNEKYLFLKKIFFQDMINAIKEFEQKRIVRNK